MDIGIQQLMIGKTLKDKNEAIRVLNMLKENHYSSIELDGFMIRKVPFIVKLLTDMSGMPTGNSNKLNWIDIIKETGLKVVSVHEDLGTIEDSLDMIVDECSTYQCKYVVITGMYQYDYDSKESLDSLVDRLNKAGEKFKEKGISLLYHNHNVEFSRREDGLTSYEYIVNNTNPEFVNFEFDGYWATDAGINVIKMIDKLGTRLKLYHINDRQKKVKGKSITPIVKFDAAELGTGVMDIEGIIEALERNKCEAIILETHRNWVDGDPLKSALISGEFLQKAIK